MKSNKKALIVFTVIILELLLVIVLFYLMSSMRHMLDEDSKVAMMEIISQNEKSINEQVASEIKQLKMISDRISRYYSDFPEVLLRNYLEDRNDFLDSSFLMVVDKNKKIYTYRDDIARYHRDSIYKSIKGEANIAHDVLESGEEIYLFTVPIYTDGEVTGVLQMARNSESMLDLFSLSIFENMGYIYIINDDGDVIIHTGGQTSHGGSGNHYMDLAKNDTKSREIVEKDLLANKPGFLEVNINGKKYFSAYSPITGIEGWNIVSSVPLDVISKNSNNVIIIFYIILLVILTAIMLAFLLFLRYKHQKDQILQQMAFEDSLTGGRNYNRFLMDGMMLLKKHPNKPYAVVKFDIDNFKYINSFYGYEKGDEVLKLIYQSIHIKLSFNEIIGRITGDNFAILINYVNLNEIKQLFLFIENLRNSGEFKVQITYSVGIYIASDRNESLKSMVDKASIAAKTIKGTAKNHFAIYSDEMQAEMLNEQNVKQTMYEALKNGEFVPFYQPKYNVYSSEIVGAEALVRWVSPQAGIIPPSSFINIFEKCGFIVEIDMYMLECVCKHMNEWIIMGKKLIPISVNFSRIHLYEKNFIDRVTNVIREYRIPPNLIEIELTESAIFDNMALIYDMTTKLKENGFILTMDDFGSGYSSLNMLKEIPIDVLKIDRGFFSMGSDNTRQQIVIELIVEMAKKLGIEVVSEGVEKIEQVEFLKKIGCNIAQGFYYAKPMAASDFTILMN